MLREDLKKELDNLNEEQLRKIADFIADLEFKSRPIVQSNPFWQRATSVERSREFRKWISQLPKNGLVYLMKPLAAMLFMQMTSYLLDTNVVMR